ncbi:DUF5684 domain-containing protein [Saccharopolyspora rosea]|uniref:DUF5684 domain-containing protein n=1 Tax=Saccharopolyspora rosea TaxID=524884 RepID=A0ABW3FNX6_9PSEU|nr:DUF5684 domain-containing protein [Saccharopolyspora rosea]
MHFARNHVHHHVQHGGGGGLAALGTVMTVVILVSLVVSVLMIAATWRLFGKAGQPGWAAIIPFYNTVVLLRTAGRPGWWLVLMLIPIVNVVVSVVTCLDLAKSFGKGAGFGVLTFLFPIIGFPILGFGGANYVGPGGQPLHPGQPYPDEASTMRYSRG